MDYVSTGVKTGTDLGIDKGSQFRHGAAYVFNFAYKDDILYLP